MEGAKAELSAQIPSPTRKARHVVVGKMLASRSLLKLITLGISLGQKMGARQFLPASLRRSFDGIRPIAPRSVESGVTYLAIGDRIGKVGFLTGCVMNVWFSDVHTASVALLQRAGYDVVIPAAQTCCGALAAHDGDVKNSTHLAEQNVTAFSEFDTVVSDSAGCGAHLKEYGHWVGESGSSFSQRVFDITEVVARAVTDGRIPSSTVDRGKVAVQDPCHLRHAQRIVEQPRTILRAAGYTPIEIDSSGQCCGAAGIYSLLQPELSQRLGVTKADQVRASGVTTIASANPGCEMQLRSHLEAGYEIVHPVELLWQAIGS